MWWFLLKEVQDTAKTRAGSKTFGGCLQINKWDQDPKTSSGNRLGLRKQVILSQQRDKQLRAHGQESSWKEGVMDSCLESQ